MKNQTETLNAFLVELRKVSVLSETKPLSEESMQKVCIITDLVKLAKLENEPPPTVQEFDTMYDHPIKWLEDLLYQRAQIRHLKECMLRH